MHNVKKSPAFIALVFMIVISLVLMIYTAYRTVHFIQKTLPPESWLLAFFALGAFDLGLLGWIALHTWHASSEQQRAISLTMICVDVAGLSVTFVVDTIMQAATNGVTGKLDTGWTIVAVLVTGGIIVANVVAFIAYHLQSPDHKNRITQERLRNAIEAEANKMVEQQVEVLASQLAPRIAADKMRRMGAQFTAGLGQMPQLPSAGSARQVTRPAGKGSARPAPRPNNVRVMADEYPVEPAPPKPRFIKRETRPAGPIPDYIEQYAAQEEVLEAEQVAERYAQPQGEEGEQEPDFLSQDQPPRTITLNTKRGSQEVEL